MLSLHTLRGAGAGGSGAAGIVKYCSESDYYSEGSTTQATWYGPGCEDVGVTAGGVVDLNELTNMLRGYDPQGEILGRQEPGENHVCGLDLTFSSPKSVSLLRAIAGPEDRAEIDLILLNARKAALDYAVQQGAFVTVITEKSRRIGTEPARPTFAIFAHNQSRYGDPQSHAHVLALNTSVGADGTARAIEFSGVWRKKLELGAVMRSFEARAFQRAGFTVEKDKSSYRVVAFSRATERHFSKGSAAIDEYLIEQGLGKSAKAKGLAALKIRDEKSGEPRDVTDQRHRDEILMQSGLDAVDVSQMKFYPQPLSGLQAKPGFDGDAIIDALSDRGVYFRDTDLRTAVATACQGVFDVEINSKVAEVLASRGLVRIYNSRSEGPWTTQTAGYGGLSSKDRKIADKAYENRVFKELEYREKHSVEDYVSFVQDKWQTDNVEKAGVVKAAAKERKQLGWTTRETLYADREIARFVAEARPAEKHKLEHKIVDQAIVDFEKEMGGIVPDFKLSEQQRAAIYHAATQGDVAAIEGVAGAGKSTFLTPLARAYEAAGYKVIGITFQGINKSALGKDAGIETFTIDKFLGMTKPGGKGERLKINDKTIILVDEGGQVGGLKMHAVQRAVEAAGCKLVISGHTAQMGAIAGTASMKLILDTMGVDNYAYISQTMRQRNAEHGIALTKLSESDAVDALVMHAAEGKFHLADGQGFEESALAYKKQVAMLGVERSFVLTDTNAAMRRVNNEIRKDLKVAGVVAEQDFRVTLTDKNSNEYQTELSLGDRVITRTKTKSEAAIQNGEVWIIKAIDEVSPGRLKIGMELASGAPVDPTGRMRVEIDTSTTKNLHLAYAMTVALSQGKTKDSGAVLISDASSSSMSQWYVALSRFRDLPNIIVSKFAVRDMAATQGREVADAMDIRQAAAVIVASAEDTSKMKSHSLDGAYELPKNYGVDHEVDDQLIAEKEGRDQDRLLLQSKDEEAQKARINVERDTAGVGVRGAGKATAEPTSEDGRLKEGAGDIDGLFQSAVQAAANAAALAGVKSETDYHAMRAAAKAVIKAAEEAAKKVLKAARDGIRKKGSKRPGLVELTRIAQEAKDLKLKFTPELAKAAARVNETESAFRDIPEKTDVVQIEQALAAKQAARDDYRKTMPEAEQKVFDSRCIKVDEIDSKSPASIQLREQTASAKAEAERLILEQQAKAALLAAGKEPSLGR